MGIGAATNHLSWPCAAKELLSATGRCAGRGCALIKQLANMSHNKITQSDLEMHSFVGVVLR